MRLALPAEAALVAGSAGLMHQVTWVATLRATPPVFADVRGGELVLLSVDAARSIDPRLTLATMVRRLVQVPVSVVAAIGEIDEADIEAANRVGLPLIRMPADSNVREIEREVKRLITDYEAQLERRGAQLYNLLTQRSIQSEGEGALLETLAEHTAQGVAFYAPNGDIRIQLAQGQAQVALQALRPAASGDHSLLNQQIWVESIAMTSGSTAYSGGYIAL
ncbi:MAG: PucR family transcriptional regulator, partial [Chloroflexaceae bacterium]|nr:PucR family transcriptional regulator [Chloroflexaceae bacterium]